MIYLYAFLIGGLICMIGQLLLLFTNLTSARILVFFVTAGVVLTALGLYAPLVQWAGAGATVPLTGFGGRFFDSFLLGSCISHAAQRPIQRGGPDALRDIPE